MTAPASPASASKHNDLSFRCLVWEFLALETAMHHSPKHHQELLSWGPKLDLDNNHVPFNDLKTNWAETFGSSGTACEVRVWWLGVAVNNKGNIQFLGWDASQRPSFTFGSLQGGRIQGGAKFYHIFVSVIDWCQFPPLCNEDSAQNDQKCWKWLKMGQRWRKCINFSKYWPCMAFLRQDNLN